MILLDAYRLMPGPKLDERSQMVLPVADERLRAEMLARPSLSVTAVSCRNPLRDSKKADV